MIIRSNETNNPYITQKTVGAALNSLLFCSQTRAPNLLEQSLLVDLFMTYQGVPISPDHRTCALNRLLVAVITEELLRYRRSLQLPWCGHETTLSEVYKAISLDAERRSLHLLWWSWLYYRFVRVEFNITVEDFGRIVCIDERTIRRYQQRGIRRLTYLLIDREQAIRQCQSETRYHELFTPENLRDSYVSEYKQFSFTKGRKQ